MRKTFVSAAVTAALCSLAISVAPAVGHEFFGDRSSAVIDTSNTTQTFQLGSEQWVECAKLETKFTPELTLSSKLKLKLEKYTTCVYNHPSESQIVTSLSSGCLVVLKSTALRELFANEFDEGLAKPECELHFNTTSCEVTMKEPTTTLPEFEWRNKDTISGHYESLLIFRLEKWEYSVKRITGSCGSGGTNGEYNGSLPLEGVIVK